MGGEHINVIAEVIQLAVAPVFLLAGIAGILSVLSHRLSRVIDRTRIVKRFLHELSSDQHLKVLRAEADSLKKRTKIINWSIRLAVGGALMICVVIMCLFIGDIVLLNLGNFIAFLFVGAMLLIVLALILFIVEVTVHTRNMHHDVEHLLVDSRKNNI